MCGRSGLQGPVCFFKSLFANSSYRSCSKFPSEKKKINHPYSTNSQKTLSDYKGTSMILRQEYQALCYLQCMIMGWLKKRIICQAWVEINNLPGPARLWVAGKQTTYEYEVWSWLPRFEFWLPHLLVLWSWRNYLTNLGLSFLMWKMEVIIIALTW